LRNFVAVQPGHADVEQGDLLRRAGKPAGERSMLRIASAHLQTYQKRRLREIRAGKGA
jgi:hypothetical protein